MRRGWIGLLCSAALLLPSRAIAAPRYRRDEIARARFGDAGRSALLVRARGLASGLNQEVIGQEAVAQALQDALVQYLEQWGSLSKAPLARHVIGLPGRGKSALVEVMAKKLGINLVRIEAQQFGGSDVQKDVE